MAELDERLSRLRPLPQKTWTSLTRLFAAEDVRFTWASNALEGNTLTLRETQRVLEDGATIAGKSMRDHLEAVNHAAAVRRMHEIADGASTNRWQATPRGKNSIIPCSSRPITARLLMNAHLLQHRYPPLIIEPDRRGAYLDALDAGQETGDAGAFRLFVTDAMQQSLEHYAQLLR